MKSIVIVEDDLPCRLAYAEALALAPDLHLAGMADDVLGGLRLLQSEQPDVLLVDIGLPSGSGIELIRFARRYLPHSESVVITLLADDHSVLESIAAGATGYLLKEWPGIDLVQQIRMLLAGGSPITPAIARRLIQHMGGKRCHAALPSVSEVTLSEQEQCVLQYSAKGYSYEEIAKLLHLSHHTVETYVKRIYRKLQVHSKTEAVYEARKIGLVED